MSGFHSLRAVIGLLLVSGGAVATAAEPPQSPVKLDIPGQLLMDALNELARQSGLQVVIDLEDGNRFMTKRVVGTFTPSAALDSLLAGTELKYEYLNERTVAVKSAVLKSRRDVGSAPQSPGANNGPRETTIRVAQADSGEATDSPWARRMANEYDPGAAHVEVLEEIVITGSNIRGAAPAGSKLITIDREAIDNSGYGRLEDIIATLPQNFNGVNEVYTQPVNSSNKGSEIQLRGLGAGTTLTLVNGHRVPSGGTRGLYVDVASIPTSAIERVEILTDGASAIYGSDAIAGVANIILRKDYEGAETRARFSAAPGGGEETQVAQLLGVRWDSGNLLLGYQYYDREPLLLSERKYFAANYDLTPFGGSDFRPQFRQYSTSPGTIVNPATGMPLYGFNGYTDNVTGAEILSEQTLHSAFLSGTQRLGERWELFADARFSTREVDHNVGPPSAVFQVTSANPFYQNPSGGTGPLSVAYDFSDDLGMVKNLSTTDTFVVTLGSSVRLGRAWQIKIDGSYGEERASQSFVYLNGVATAAVQAALADRNPATAYNLFGPTNRATLDTIRASMPERNGGVSSVWSGTVIADGPLFSIDGRTARLAFGADYRHDQLRTLVTSLGRQDRTFSERDMSAVFTELALPVLEDVDVSLAARFEEYSDFGSTLNPKLGVNYTPLASLKLRGTWGTSFRAPPFARSNESISRPRATISFLPDPQATSGTTTKSIRLFGNNDGLKEETATVWTGGLDFAPQWLPGAQLSLTYFDIDYDDRIDAVNTTLVQEHLFPGLIRRNPSPAEVAAICTSGDYTVTGDCSGTIGAILDIRYRNVSSVHTNGLDFELRHALPTRSGDWSYGVGGTYLFGLERQLTEASPESDVVDTLNNPVSLRMRATLGWSLRALSVNAVVNYVTDYKDVTQQASVRTIDSWTTLDLSATLRSPLREGWLSGTQLTLSAVNVFDEDPPFVNSSATFDGANASILGRLLALQVTKAW